jgi:hypothetical protein
MPRSSCRGRLNAVCAHVALLLTGAVLSACAQPSRFGADTWQEEVLLQDGRRIIVERSQTYGGRHEVGQSQPVREHTLRFTLPNSSKTITWTSEYGEELGRTNFNLLALHIRGNTPYVVAEPNLCLSYNKWGRPNPPYVFFRYDGTEWDRVAIEEVPNEFNSINLIVSTGRLAEIERSSKSTGYVPSESGAKINAELRAPALKTILREPLSKQKLESGCPELVLYKGAWVGPGDSIGKRSWMAHENDIDVVSKGADDA